MNEDQQLKQQQQQHPRLQSAAPQNQRRVTTASVSARIQKLAPYSSNDNNSTQRTATANTTQGLRQQLLNDEEFPQE